MPKHFRLVYDYLHVYLRLGQSRVIAIIRYRYKGKAVIYIVRNTVTSMLYVGSTLSPSLRFYHHLVTGDLNSSNAQLQSAITEYGIEKFNLYIMELVVFPSGLSYEEKRAFLRKIEQSYIAKYPQDQLYNEINSSNS